MSIFDQSAVNTHELSKAFTSAGMNDAVRYSRGEIEAAPQEIAFNPNLLNIKPEALAGLCNAVGQALCVMGLASAEQAQPPQSTYGNLTVI